MTPEEQLVQQIREVVRSEVREVSPVIEDLAEQYADVCSGANARLLKCAEFLDKGMRSEAVYEANSAPALLDLVRAINFADAIKWRNLCDDLGLPTPPPLHLEIVDRLQEEFGKEQDLAPLLKQYRRLVYQGDQDGCVSVLREIRAHDPENRVWIDNLRSLEQAQLADLVEEIKHALADNDLPRLAELQEEILQPQRVVPVPQDLARDVSAILSAERRTELGAEGNRVVLDLQACVEREDFEGTGALFQQWDELVEDECFEPTRALTRVVDEARAWYEAEAARRTREAQSRAAQAAMREALRPPLDAELVRTRWDELAALGTLVPAALKADVDAAFTRIDLRRRRRRSRRRLLLAAACVAAAAVVGLLFLAHWRRQSRARALAHLSDLAEAERHRDVLSYLEVLGRRDPGFGASPQVGHFRGAAEEALRQRAERTKNLDVVMAELDSIRRGGFEASEARIRALLAEAATLATGLDREMEVNDWRKSWELRREREVRKTSLELEQLLVLIRQGLAGRAQREFASLDLEEEVLGQLQARRREAETLGADAGTENAAAIASLAAQLDAWAADLAQRRQTLAATAARHDELLRRIPDALPDLALYADLVGQYVEEFPKASETPYFRRALEQMTQYEQATALQGITVEALPLAADKLAAVQALIAESGRLNRSVWEPDLRACVRYTEANAAARAALPGIGVDNRSMVTMLLLHYRKKGEEAWKPLYHPKPLASREDKDETGERFRSYWGEVYHFTPGTPDPWLEHTSRLFPERLNTRDYEIRVHPRAQDNIVSHGQFLRNFLGEALEAEELDIHLLEGVGKLLADEEMSAIPRAWLLKRFVHLLDDAFGDLVPGLPKLLNLADSMRTDAPWINSGHPDVVAAEQGIRETLPNFPDVLSTIRALRANRRLLVRALSRRLRCAGSFQLDRDGRLRARPAIANPGTAWILVLNAGMVRPQFKIAVDGPTVAESRLTPAAMRDVFLGQVFFTPGDTEPSREAAARALGQAVEPADVQWPLSWPVNGR